MRWRAVARWLLAIFYCIAGYFHLTAPEPFLKITPEWVPMAEQVVWWTGIAEFAGAIGLIQPWSKPLRRAAAIGLAAYALCVWPANINHMIMDFALPDSGMGPFYHLPRMAVQPVLIWLALWAGEVIRWPFAKDDY